MTFRGSARRTLVVGCTLVGALMAAPTWATTITFNFSGTVDLSPGGGPSASTFSGSVSWDPTETPFHSGSVFADYRPAAATFVLNGTDDTSALFTGFDEIVVSADPPAASGFAVELFFNPPGVAPGGVGEFVAEWDGPGTLFTSTALPSDLTFVAQLTPSLTFPGGGQFEASDNSWFADLSSLLPNASAPIPEPATLTLTALGLAGVIGRCRRRAPR